MIAVIMATVLLLSQKNVDGQWGLSFLNGSGKSRADKHAQQVDNRCVALATEYHLTARELEILMLLARHKTVGMIERDLVIANGTAKAHVRHIYQKLNIHSREELFNLLDPRQFDPGRAGIGLIPGVFREQRLELGGTVGIGVVAVVVLVFRTNEGVGESGRTAIAPPLALA